MRKIEIQNGRVIDPANQIDKVCNIYIADGKIISLDKKPDGFKADQIINAKNKIVCPGLIDLAARLREPGQESKGTIESETTAAASAGITTVCCPPDTNPVIDNRIIVDWITQRAQDIGKARVLVFGALTQGLCGLQLSNMAELKAAGCVGVSDVGAPMLNPAIRRRCFEYAANFGIKVFLNPEAYRLAENGCMHEGMVSTRLGLPGIPETAETIALARDLLLIEETGVAAHFCRLSTARGVEMIAQAQARGLPVTADVAAHQLYLTEIDASTYDSNCHVRPPLRTETDRLGLLRGLTKGVVTAICSDHQPHDNDAKQVPFSQSAPGISALETLLPLTLRLTEKNSISLAQALSWITSAPAKILNSKTGTLTPGAIADICIFDDKKYWTLAKDGMVSCGHNTPFLNWEFRGKAECTILGGKIAYQNESSTSPTLTKT